jgi:hypothetical protein
VIAEYHTAAPVQLRQDGCSFCSTRGVKSASDPKGTLTLRSSRRMIRYRFGHRTADCPTCATYVATSMDADGGPVGVLNLAGMNVVVYAGLQWAGIALRQKQRESRW